MAMTTQQRQGQTGDTIIPTPNVITDTSHYDQVYHRDALRSVQYIRMSGEVCIYKLVRLVSIIINAISYIKLLLYQVFV